MARALASVPSHRAAPALAVAVSLLLLSSACGSDSAGDVDAGNPEPGVASGGAASAQPPRAGSPPARPGSRDASTPPPAPAPDAGSALPAPAQDASTPAPPDACADATCGLADPCTVGNGGCDPLTECRTPPGGVRSCGPCPAGYVGDGVDGCSDVDECATDNGGCDPLAECENLAGAAPVCGDCVAGTVDDGLGTCVDVDECLIDNGGCDPLTTCQNQVAASPLCGDCPALYYGSGATGCLDVDECQTNNGGCDPVAPCENQVGAPPTCGDCPADYSGDGATGCSLLPGKVEWVRTVHDTELDMFGTLRMLPQYAFAVSALPDGSGFVLGGRFTLHATFGEGEARATTLSGGPYAGTTYSESDAYVARYDARGRLQWVTRNHAYRPTGGSQDAFSLVSGLAVSASGDIFATGFHAHLCGTPCETVYGLGEPNETRLTSTYAGSVANDKEAFVASFAPNGQLRWARTLDSVNYSRAYRITALSDGSVVVVGEFNDAMTLGAGEANETTLTPSAQLNAFIARFGADGALSWARQTSGDCLSELYAVDALPDAGGVIIGGSFGGGPRGGCEVILDEGNASEQRIGNLNDLNRFADFEPFFARLDVDGNAVWMEWMRSEWGHTAELSVDAVAVTAGGTIYVTGAYESPLLLDEGLAGEVRLSRMFGGSYLAAYDTDAALLWARDVGGWTSTLGTNLAVDDLERPVMAGEFGGSDTFGLGDPTEVQLDSPLCYLQSYTASAFVAGYTALGELRWVTDAACSTARAIDVVPGGPVVAAGYYWSETTFGAGEPNATTIDSGQAQTEEDVFIAGVVQ